VAIRQSASKEIRGLVADLASDHPATRDAAVARLTVIGSRAGTSLAAVVSDRSAPAGARLASLRILEATADAAALEALLLALDDSNPDIVVAAVAAVRPHLRGARGATAVDRLTAVALDRTRTHPVREAAVRLLLTLEKSSVRPLLKALRSDPSPPIAALADAERPRRSGATNDDARQVVINAAAGQLPRDGDGLRRALAERGAELPLPRLLAIVEHLRDHERTTPARERRHWTAARAAAHVVLARRGSRVALYDLRESVQRAREPLPAGFLTALGEIGDASCVEAIAAAFSATTERDWWRLALAEAFRKIVRRHRLTRRHTAIKRIERRSPAVLVELWPA
jgi:hypothetical protein